MFVCLSVSRIPVVYSQLERHKKSMFFGEITSFMTELNGEF